MGIRYYGWAIHADEVTEAADHPRRVIRRADRRHYLPGWTNTSFDKAWHLMQRLFSPDWPRTRPGYELVAGDVTYPHDLAEGYEPYIGVLSCDRLPAIARDVASVSTADVRLSCAGLCYDDRRRRDDVGYLTHYVAAAKAFTADAAARGHGIVYMIG